MSYSRHLAAIMFADIAGYTALMQHDENLALKTLHRFKSELNLRVKEFRGKIIQYYGDGCLITFTNSADAVECAKILQEIFRTDPNVPVRIGIHLGDVILEEGNVFGDSVNITSRIESMGIPGAVLLSDTIQKQIKNKLEFQFTSLGNFDFKNVDEPIEVFALSNNGFPVPNRSELIGKFKEPKTITTAKIISAEKKKPKKKLFLLISVSGLIILFAGYFIFQTRYSVEKNSKQAKNEDTVLVRSIAVLPFDDYSPKKDQAWFTDGMTDALITELAKISSLSVRSRTSVMQYKGTTKTIPEIAKELNVDAVIEGSALKNGDSVRITAQLINSHDKHLWANDFDGGMKDVFRLHHDIAQAITKGINITLTPSDSARFTKPSTVNPAALEADLKGLKIYFESQTIEQVKDAVNHFQQAISIDSTYAKAYAHIASAYFAYPFLCEKNPLEALQLAESPNNTALRLDPQLTIAWLNKFSFLYYIKWNWEEALSVLSKAQSFSLNDPLVLDNLVNYYVISGKFDKAFETCEKIHQIAPTEALYWEDKAYTQFHSRDLEGVLRTTEEGLKLFPDDGTFLEFQSWAFSLLGRHEEAIKVVRKILSMTHGFSPIRHGEAGCIFARAGLKNEAIKELETIQQLKLNYIDPVSTGLIYMGLGNKDKAMEYFEKGYTIHSGWIPFLKRSPAFDAMRGDSRFERLIQDLKFP